MMYIHTDLWDNTFRLVLYLFFFLNANQHYVFVQHSIIIRYMVVVAAASLMDHCDAWCREENR